MGVTVCLPLFGDPGRELEQRASSADLRRLGDDLRQRLFGAADTLDKLAAGGWSAQVGLFDLILQHPQVASREQAEARLRALGIEPEELLIVEDVEEEEAG
jgi:hypothetical protein